MTNETSLIHWTVPEYHVHDRSTRWYMLASLIGTALFVFSIFSANYLFAIIIIVVAITMILQERTDAPMIEFSINKGGISLGAKEYEYGMFKNFWIYYEPSEAKTLFFEFKNGVRPRLSIPIENKNPLRIRSLLLQFLTEDIDRENEPLSEQLTRLLKL